MSYRLHLATMEKVELEKMRKVSYQEFVDIYMGGNADKYYPAYHFPTSKEVFELGSNIDSGLLKKLVKYDENGERIHFFEDQELTNEYNNENHDLYVIGKEGLIALIEDYREKIIASYQDKLEFTKFDKFEYKKDADLAFKQQCFLESRLDNWDSKFLNYLDLDVTRPNSLSHFWDYEYLIFTLLHLLKIIDFYKHDIVIYGY